MNRLGSLALSLVLVVSALFCGNSGLLQAQQRIAPSFDQTYALAVNKARENCKALWADHSFDPLRARMPLGEEKPSFSMLTNKEKVHPKDKPLADLAIKTLEKCRRAYEPVFALLPPNVNDLVHGFQREQDALIAELYSGKITFGEYNVGMNRLNGGLSEALSGIPSQPQASALTTALSPEHNAPGATRQSEKPPVVGEVRMETSRNVQTQQSNAPPLNQTFESAVEKARQECNALWSDHAFDPLRSKIPLGDERPSFSMLTNKEKLRAKDKPLANLAMKTLEKCRSAYEPVFALLPQNLNNMIQGVLRRQDALIAQLYSNKITLGDYDVGVELLKGELAQALSGIPSPSQSAPTTAVQASGKATPPIASEPGSTTAVQASEKATPPSSSQSVATAVQASEKATPSLIAEQSNTPLLAPSNETRLALVIGNNNYANLPKLSNPTNDARSIADALQKMGYKTHLILDGSEEIIRRQVRKFANDSTKAEIAVVYYAGHAAQLNGSNYLLPTDTDIPRTEADIEYSGLRLDTLVNSIGSRTKIVLLDACRDNPVLYKNIVKGRGSSPIGLAPASAYNFTQAKPGGGVFIAYATDAGAVADDGTEAHSPFTQALLQYMQQPISIDDMFSLVTREVRLVTKNAQRPWKYATLENIVCLTLSCTSTPVAATADVVEQIKQSADQELQIALQTNNADALDSYLDKYPDTSQRVEISNQIENIKRAEFTEWTLFEVANQHFPWFMQLSSIRQFGSRVAVKVRYLLDPSAPKVFGGKSFPDAVYAETLSVYDCANLMADAEQSIFSGSGDLLFHYKWADPQFLNLAIGAQIVPRSIGYTARNIVCHERSRTPIVTKKQLRAMKLASLASMPAGDGEIFYALSRSGKDIQEQREAVVLVKNNIDHNVKDFFPQGVSIPDPPSFRTEVDWMQIRCDRNDFAITKTEFWNASDQLVRVVALDPGADVPYSQFQPYSVHATLQAIACPNGYAGLGVQIALDKDAVKVTRVYDDSPAERAGIRAGDIITQISNEPIGGLALAQVTEMLRGIPNSEVNLTISREGSSSALQFKVSRDIVHVKSPQETVR
jgi:uncharacterized caspase-like protein